MSMAAIAACDTIPFDAMGTVIAALIPPIESEFLMDLTAPFTMVSRNWPAVRFWLEDRANAAKAAA